MPHTDLDRLRGIKTLPSLVAYLRDELDWPIDSDDIEDTASISPAPNSPRRGSRRAHPERLVLKPALDARPPVLRLVEDD